MIRIKWLHTFCPLTKSAYTRLCWCRITANFLLYDSSEISIFPIISSFRDNSYQEKIITYIQRIINGSTPVTDETDIITTEVQIYTLPAWLVQDVRWDLLWHQSLSQTYPLAVALPGNILQPHHLSVLLTLLQCCQPVLDWEHACNPHLSNTNWGVQYLCVWRGICCHTRFESAHQK